MNNHPVTQTEYFKTIKAIVGGWGPNKTLIQPTEDRK